MKENLTEEGNKIKGAYDSLGLLDPEANNYRNVIIGCRKQHSSSHAILVTSQLLYLVVTLCVKDDRQRFCTF